MRTTRHGRRYRLTLDARKPWPVPARAAHDSRRIAIKLTAGAAFGGANATIPIVLTRIKETAAVRADHLGYFELREQMVIDRFGVAQRAAALRHVAGSMRTTAPPLPKSAKIELDTRCNLVCRFCSRTRSGPAPGAMDRHVFRGIVRDLRSSGVEQLGLFFMSEPFLCDWLPEAIAWAKRDAGMPYVFVTTNGIAAGENMVRECIDAGLDSLKFALNFADQDQLGRAGGSPEAFESILANAVAARRVRDEIARDGGRWCRLSASSLEYDAHQGARIVPLMTRIADCFDEHYWLPLFGRQSDAPLPVSSGEDDVILRKPVPCWTLFTEAHVRADGKLSACCLDASERFVMGDLTVTGFEQAWLSEPFRALRAAHLGGDLRLTACERCLGAHDVAPTRQE